MLGSGAALLNTPAPVFAAGAPADSFGWSGYAGIGDYARANGNTESVRDAAHLIRDGKIEALRRQMNEMFAATGFDDRRDIAGIVLNRWGHSCLVPTPGFFHGRDGRPPPAAPGRAGETIRPHRLRSLRNEWSAGVVWRRGTRGTRSTTGSESDVTPAVVFLSRRKS